MALRDRFRRKAMSTQWDDEGGDVGSTDGMGHYIEWVPTEHLRPMLEWDRDENGIPGRTDDVLESLNRLGFKNPIWVDFNDLTNKAHVSEGNHRLTVALRAGIPAVPVSVNRSLRVPRNQSILRPYKYVGDEVDPHDPNYVPQYMKPSEIGMPTTEPWSPPKNARIAMPVVPVNWDVLNQPREQYVGESPSYPGERDDFVNNKPAYKAWREQAEPEYQAHRQREKDWDRAARHAMAVGRMTPEQVTALGYRAVSHEMDTDWGAPAWGKWQPLPPKLYHATTNLPAVLQSGILRSPHELDLMGMGRGLGGGTQDTISLTDSRDEAQNIKRAMIEGADVASGRLPIERLVEMAKTGEGADKPWLNAIFGTHDWSKGNPQGLDDLLLGRKPFYNHLLPEDHPLKGLDSWQGHLPEEEWAKHGYYPRDGSYPLGTPGNPDYPRYTAASVYRNLTPEEKAIEAFEWWRNPWASFRSWAGGPSDPIFTGIDPHWFANLDPSHVGVVETEPKPNAHGYPLSSLGEWRVPTGEGLNIVGHDGQLPEHTASGDLDPRLNSLLGPESNAHVAVRVRHDNLPYVLQNGIPNVHDYKAPGDDRDDAYLRMRREVESPVFSKPPIYGYMATPDEHLTDNHVKAFGDTKLILKPHVRDNTTFTYSDSVFGGMGERRSGAPLPASVNYPTMQAVPERFHKHIPHIRALTAEIGHDRNQEPPLPADLQRMRDNADRSARMAIERPGTGWEDEARQQKQNFNNSLDHWLRTIDYNGEWSPWPFGDFFEAQIHQPVRPEDIAAIASPHPITPEIREMTSRLSIPYFRFDHEPQEHLWDSPQRIAGEPQRSWHLTDRHDFALDPEIAPQDNTLSITDRWGRKGLYLGDPEHWFNGYDYVRPFVAEIEHPPVDRERWGGENFLPAEMFPQSRVHRVIPLDEYAREHYGEHGWYETLQREDMHGKPLQPIPKGYRYEGPDVREMDPATIERLKARTQNYIKMVRPHLMAVDDPCPTCRTNVESVGTPNPNEAECKICGNRYPRTAATSSFPGPEYLVPGQRYVWWSPQSQQWRQTGEPRNFNPNGHITWATYLGPHRHADYQRAAPEIPEGHAFQITQGGYDGRTKMVRGTKGDPEDRASQWENVDVMDDAQLRDAMEHGAFGIDHPPSPMFLDQINMQAEDQANRDRDAQPMTIPEEWDQHTGAAPGTVYGYHASPSSNRESIAQEGLKLRSNYQGDVVCFYASDPWHGKPVTFDVWQADLTGMGVEPDPMHTGIGALMVRQPVPPQRLTLLHKGLRSMDELPNWPHVSSTPDNRSSGKLATMTLPQEKREWNDLRSFYAELAQDENEDDYSVDDPHPAVLHTYPDGWTVQHHPSQASAQTVGGFMRNCWQDRNVSWQAAPGYMRAQFAALHDEHGLPRAAFYWHPQRRIITAPLGMRNDSLTPDLEAKLEEFKQATPDNGRYGAPWSPAHDELQWSSDEEAHQPSPGRAGAQGPQGAAAQGEEVLLRGVRARELRQASGGDANPPVIPEHPEFPDLDDAVEAHDEAVEASGQHSALLSSPDHLESALGRAEHHWYYGDPSAPPHERLFGAAAALGHGVAQAQAFEDGNKRTAYWLMYGLLDRNGLGHVLGGGANPWDDPEMATIVNGWGEGTHERQHLVDLWKQRHESGGPRQANILDPIEKTLDPAVFDHPEAPRPVLKPALREWLLDTIYNILEQGGYEGPERWARLYLTGSLTTYQYAAHSDCDISIFVNNHVFPEWSRAEMIGLMVESCDGLTLPGTPHELQVFVVAKGIEPEDLYQRGLRSGYDLINEEWVVAPEHDRAHDVSHENPEGYATGLMAADKMERLLRYEPDKAVIYYGQLHRKRMRDQKDAKGDFSTSNLIYKMLDNRGLFDRLRELGVKIAAEAQPPSEPEVLGVKMSAEVPDHFPEDWVPEPDPNVVPFEQIAQYLRQLPHDQAQVEAEEMANKMIESQKDKAPPSLDRAELDRWTPMFVLFLKKKLLGECGRCGSSHKVIDGTGTLSPDGKPGTLGGTPVGLCAYCRGEEERPPKPRNITRLTESEWGHPVDVEPFRNAVQIKEQRGHSDWDQCAQCGSSRSAHRYTEHEFEQGRERDRQLGYEPAEREQLTQWQPAALNPRENPPPEPITFHDWVEPEQHEGEVVHHDFDRASLERVLKNGGGTFPDHYGRDYSLTHDNGVYHFKTVSDNPYSDPGFKVPAEDFHTALAGVPPDPH